MRSTPWSHSVRRRAVSTAALALLVLAACRKDDADREPPQPPAPRAEVLRDVPALSFARLHDTTGSEDAERRTYLTLLSFDSVRTFYRDTLPKLGWSIMSDQGDTNALDIHLRKAELALWVRIERDVVDEVRRTRFTLIGTGGAAAVDAGLPPLDTVR